MSFCIAELCHVVATSIGARYILLMELRILVRAGSRTSGVETLRDGRLRVSVRAKAKDGKANEEVCAMLARHFRIAEDGVRIVRGATAPAKTVRIASRGRESQNH